MNNFPRTPSTARRLLRHAWVVGVALLVASVAGTGWILHTPAAGPAKGGDKTPEKKTVIFAYGDVRGGMRQLYPVLAMPNHVKEVKVKENDTVAAGAVLVEMDDTLARTNLERAEADLKDAEVLRDQAKKSQEKHELDLRGQELAISAVQHKLAAAKKALDRYKRAREKGLTSEEEVDAADEMVKSLEDAENLEKIKLDGLKLQDPTEDLTRAEQKVKEKRAVRDQAEYALKLCTLTAPVEGTIVRLNVNAGDLLGPQPHQPAILFCPNTPRILRGEVLQEFADPVKVGQRATIQDDTTNTGKWEGTVVQLSDVYTSRRSINTDVPFQLNDVRTRECIIELDPGQKPPVSINQRMRVTLVDREN
jgi:multidrug resistance efflux pump